MGDEAFARGDLDAAHARYARIVEQAPGSARGRLGLGRVARARGDEQEAHREFLAATEIDPSLAWLCAGGSYMGSTSELDLDMKFQGFKGMFSGESLFFMRVSGEGHLLVNAFGRITELEVDGQMIVDTGHLVAFEEGLEYKITKAGGSWVSSFVAGEGLVMEFTGKGKVLVQSHNPKEFGTALGNRLPPRQG